MGFAPDRTFSESLDLHGQVDIFVAMGKPNHILIGKIDNPHGIPLYRDHRIDFTHCRLIDTQSIKNIILNQGKDAIIDSLVPRSSKLKVLGRMCVGDRGTSPSDSTSPKSPSSDRTSLYNEVYRADVEAVVTNIRTTGGLLHEVRLVKTFASNGTGSIPITAFSNQGSPVLNEVALVMLDPSKPAGYPRTDNSAPYVYPTSQLPITPLNLYPYPYQAVSPYNYPPQDEDLFSMRTFKSVPFQKENDITITIRYTIYIA